MVGPHPRQHLICTGRHFVGEDVDVTWSTEAKSACRLRMHEEPAGGILSATGDRRRTAGKGSDRAPILVEPHARLVMAVKLHHPVR